MSLVDNNTDYDDFSDLSNLEDLFGVTNVFYLDTDSISMYPINVNYDNYLNNYRLGSCSSSTSDPYLFI